MASVSLRRVLKAQWDRQKVTLDFGTMQERADHLELHYLHHDVIFFPTFALKKLSSKKSGVRVLLFSFSMSSRTDLILVVVVGARRS